MAEEGSTQGGTGNGTTPVEITPGGAVGDQNQAVFSLGGTQFAVLKDEDGVIRLNNERYVPEKDLIAHKQANERRIAELTEQHQTSTAQNMNESESTRQLLLQAQAERDKLQEQVNAGMISAEAVQRAQADAEAMKTSLLAQTELALNYRKDAMVLRYNLKPEQLIGKDMNQLTYFEEAMQAVGVAQVAGTSGNYAAGGGQGGAPTPMSDMERASAALDKASKEFSSPKST